MRLIRGTGMRGLGGIHPRILVEDMKMGLAGEIVRPLLGIRRRELEQYLNESDSPGVKIRPMPIPEVHSQPRPQAGVAAAGAGVQSRRGRESCRIGGDCPRRRRLLGERNLGLDGDSGAVVGAGVGAREVAADGLVQIALSGQDPPFARTARARSTRIDLRVADRDRWLVMNASVDRPWFLGEPNAVQRRVLKAIGDRPAFRWSSSTSKRFCDSPRKAVEAEKNFRFRWAGNWCGSPRKSSSSLPICANQPIRRLRISAARARPREAARIGGHDRGAPRSGG